MVADDVVEHEIGLRLSNYHLWWRKVTEAIDPNGVTPEGGALVSVLLKGDE